MQYDLIALDLDGTALSPHNQVNPAVREAVQWARRRGVHVVISTGRICSEAAEFAHLLGTDDEMVSSGGAALSSASQGKCFHRTSMGWESACRAAAACERYGLSTMVYVGDQLLMTPYDEMMFGKYKSNEGFLAAKTVVPSVAEAIADQRIAVDKVFTRSQNPQHLAVIRQQLAGVEGLRLMSSADDNIEIIAPDADKGRALGELCKRFGTTLERTIAIGDSENDREMLLAVGMPVAMGNAREDIKEICHFTTKSNAEDGVAYAIYNLLEAIRVL